MRRVTNEKGFDERSWKESFPRPETERKFDAQISHVPFFYFSGIRLHRDERDVAFPLVWYGRQMV